MSPDSASRMPTVFLSHGSPTVLTDRDEAHAFLSALGGKLPRPDAILVVSAHWETRSPSVSLAARPETIHDFGGFARELYDMTYPVPGAPQVAERVAALVEGAGFPVERHAARGLDHGAWVPLKLMYPDADIPATQLSIQTGLGPAHHLQVGQALGPLRDEGVLIIGSGSATHNLDAVFAAGFDHDAPVPDWAMAFTDWLHGTVTGGRVDDALAYLERAPYGQENHPSEDHILPLFSAWGAGGGDAAQATRLHAGYSFGALAMDAYRFD